MALSNLIVPDASVIIKWFATEELDSKNALLLRSRFLSREAELWTPTFLNWELANYLGRNEDSDLALQVISQYQLMKIPQSLLNLTTIQLAFKIMKKTEKVSFYDAAYHALAIDKNGTFLTSDKKYYKQAHSFRHIMLLSDYS